MFCKDCKYRKYLSVCTVSIVIICTVDIVGRSSVIAASTVSIVNMCIVSIVCIFAVGFFRYRLWKYYNCMYFV